MVNNKDYTAVPLEEDTGDHATGAIGRSESSWFEVAKKIVFGFMLFLTAFSLGFGAGRKFTQAREGGCNTGTKSYGVQDDAAAAWAAKATMLPGQEFGSNGLLPPQAAVPEIPMKEVKFGLPTAYNDTSYAGDKLWNDLMPIGFGFVRVPYPRRFEMPFSKPLVGDAEKSEIYSLSALHQLHCLGVIRDVIKKYEVRSKSHFAGAGYEWNCVDYIRQSIMCSGDTTLDYAQLEPDGKRRGFSGSNSTHQCRDWDALTTWAIENRAGDKRGIM